MKLLNYEIIKLLNNETILNRYSLKNETLKNIFMMNQLGFALVLNVCKNYAQSLRKISIN